MSEEKKTNEKATSVFIENMTTLISPEGIQKYILGTKGNGTPRAVYDVVKDFTQPKKKKKKNKKKKKKDDIPASYSFYLSTKSSKKKKKKNKDKYWHI